MTATSTQAEIGQVVEALGLRSPPIILTASPVQAHIKFSVIRRPSNNYGLDGIITKEGIRKPGLMDLLSRVYLNQYIEDLRNNVVPKRCIIFSRGNGTLGEVYCRLMETTWIRHS